MVWVIETSLKESKELFVSRTPWDLPRHLHWANFPKAWVEGHFASYFMNSVIITLGSLAVILFCGALASYVVGYLNLPFSKPLSYYFLGGMTLPVQLAMLPLFFLVLKLGLFNTYTGLILLYSAGAMPFTVFVLSGFFAGLPKELHDAAEIDGASEWQTFRRVMLPLARPGLITAAIFNFLGIWNEYLYALVFITDERLKTLPLGLANLAINKQYDTDYGALFAGLVIVMVPTLLVYIALQKYLVKGLAAGAVKG